MPGGGGQRYPGCLAISDLGMVRAEPEPGTVLGALEMETYAGQAQAGLNTDPLIPDLEWAWKCMLEHHQVLCIANHLTLAYLFPPTERTPVSAPLALCVHTHVAILSQVFSSRVLNLIF